MRTARHDGLLHDARISGAPSPELEPARLDAARAPSRRYQALRLLGRGQSAEVFEVHDGLLGRSVALKRLRRDRDGPSGRERLIREAEVTARLEHPNIVRVLDAGVLESGEPYFTLGRVAGPSLERVLALLARGDRETVRAHPGARLLVIFRQVVEAVAYAHGRGVLHGDLKPADVLLGEHGEVVLADWGSARVAAAGAASRDRIETEPRARGTSDAGDELGEVFSLGAILYEILTLAPLTREGALVPPRERAPERDIRPELERACLVALGAVRGERFAGALDLARAVEAILSGTSRRELAEQRFGQGEVARARWRALEADRHDLDLDARRLSAEIKPYDGPVKKAPLWAIEEKIQENDLAREEALASALDGYAQATGLDADFERPVERLAELHLGLYLEAEAEGDRRRELFHRRQVERHHRGRYSDILSGRGLLTLRPRVPGAEIEGCRIVERGKKLVAGERLELPDRHQIDALGLPMGSYLFTLRAPGRRPTRLSVFLGRGENVELEPMIYDEEETGPDLVHVPAGPCVFGGDPVALNAGARQRVALDDFFIARYPVTCREYLEFLDDLAGREPHLVERHVPRTRPEGGYLWERDARGRFILPRFDGDGNPCHPEAPVMGVSFLDAQRFTDWRSELDGRRYRLPTEQEWEKAGRGADGRFFPWGNGFDASFCKMALSRPGRPQPEPVGSFPTDTSVYGVGDMAGGIREWCDSFYDDARETRVLRGGAWYFNPLYCRLAFRHGYLPHIVFTNFGFRLCASPRARAPAGGAP